MQSCSPVIYIVLSGLTRAIEELQGEVEVIKLRLEQQEATEKRLRSRLNKQDAISTMRKEVALLINISTYSGRVLNSDP